MLGEGSNLSEVLWNFSRFKDQRRLALKQNPHFYKDLDRRRQYGEDFQSDPIENFLDTPGHKIFVLTDRQGRVYLEQGQVSRAFGNVWCPQKSIIFKGSSESTLALQFLLISTYLQTSAESSRVKELSGHPSKESLTYGIAWSVYPLPRKQILWIGCN